jgi:hypothetical protein
MRNRQYQCCIAGAAKSAACERALFASQRIEGRTGLRIAGISAAAVIIAASVVHVLAIARRAIMMPPASSTATSATMARLSAVLTVVLSSGASFDFLAFANVVAFLAFVLIAVIAALVIHDLERISGLLLMLLALQARRPFFAARQLLLHAAFLRLEDAIARHSRDHDTIIVLGVLEIVLVLHAITARLRVACVLGVLLVNLRGCAPDLHIRTIALKRPVAVVATATTAAGLTSAPPLTLHVTILIFRYRPNWTDLGSAIAGPN